MQVQMHDKYTLIRYILQANYYLALLITLACGILSLTNSEFPFNNNSDVYGPLANNLKIMLVYLFFAEFSIFSYCSLKRSYKELTLVGLFLLSLIGAIEVYGNINQIPIDENYDVFFLYTGLSHLLFGLISFKNPVNNG